MGVKFGHRFYRSRSRHCNEWPAWLSRGYCLTRNRLAVDKQWSLTGQRGRHVHPRTQYTDCGCARSQVKGPNNAMELGGLMSLRPDQKHSGYSTSSVQFIPTRGASAGSQDTHNCRCLKWVLYILHQAIIWQMVISLGRFILCPMRTSVCSSSPQSKLPSSTLEP